MSIFLPYDTLITNYQPFKMKPTKSTTPSCQGNMFSGNREEVTNVTLDVYKGSMPDNLSGFVFFQSQCGNVNSGGLPFPQYFPDGTSNPDYGSPNLNGDGMIYKVDFSQPGEAKFTCKILKTPSYYADYATSIDGPATKANEYASFAFRNFGITRMSLMLGQCNPANTALVPVHFENDSDVSLLATYDVGRPIKINPATLEYITPIGKNEEWISAFPPLIQTPFPMYESTAHPSYDPKTRELYIANYTRSFATDLGRKDVHLLLMHKAEEIEEFLTEAAKRHELHGISEQSVNEIKEFLNKISHPNTRPKGFWNTILYWLEKLIMFILNFFFAKKLEIDDSVTVLTFTGDGPMKKNTIVNPDGSDLVINQCMHQTSISENYLILQDSSFKFAFDLLINNPFPDNPVIDKFIRSISTKTVLPNTPIWIVDRNELRNAKDGATVVGRSVPEGMATECVHFTTNYNDSNGEQITLYTAQNNAACIAEWVRLYDINHFTKQPPDESVLGYIAVGELSVSSVGKYVIDVNGDSISTTKTILKEKGTLPPVEELTDEPLSDIGPNTWGIGLYTFRDMISPKYPNTDIKTLYFVNFGADPKLLTEFIWELYKDFPNRDPESLEELEAYTKRGVPSSVLTIDTATMTITDYYEMPKDSIIVSIQFVPTNSPTPGLTPDKDGYIFVTAKVCTDGSYQSQIWLFKAWNLSEGPACVLNSEHLNFCNPLHIVWLESAPNVTSGYKINIKDDFMYTICKSTLFFERNCFKKFFNKYVFPHFD